MPALTLFTTLRQRQSYSKMHPVPLGPLALYMATVRAPDSAPDPPLTPLQGAVRGQVNGTDAACLTAKTP